MHIVKEKKWLKNKRTKKNEEELSFYERLTSTQKCAILMMLLGEEEAAEILKNLGPKKFSNLEKKCIMFKDLIKILLIRF